MPFSFPASPTVGQQSTQNGRVYEWTGAAWELVATPTAITNVVNSPSQITANQNDYSLPAADVVRLDSDAARDITGFSGGTGGRVVVLVNVGSFAITLKHQSASSTASNRVVVPWAADYIIDPSYAAVLLYDATASRWRVI